MRCAYALAAALVLGVCSAASAQPSPSFGEAREHFGTGGSAFEPNSALLQTIQYDRRGYDRRDGRPDRNAFRDRSYWDRRRGRGYYDRNYGRYQRDDSSAVAAGFLGFVLGAAIAGSAGDRAYVDPRRNESSWVASCRQRYRSFDVQSGTYLGLDGYRHYCR